MANIEKDPFYIQAIKARPFQDAIYHTLYPIKEIIRIDRNNPLENNRHKFSKEQLELLDIKLHIDTILVLQNDSILTGQEKALSYKERFYDTFTIEFYQNRETKELGEFFNLGAQFYLHGYLNNENLDDVTGFDKWYFIKIFDFLSWLKNTPISTLEKYTKPSWNSRASFFYIKYNKIPQQFIYNYFRSPTNLTQPSAAVRSTTQTITQQSLFQEANNA